MPIKKKNYQTNLVCIAWVVWTWSSGCFYLWTFGVWSLFWCFPQKKPGSGGGELRPVERWFLAVNIINLNLVCDYFAVINDNWFTVYFNNLFNLYLFICFIFKNIVKIQLNVDFLLWIIIILNLIFLQRFFLLL